LDAGGSLDRLRRRESGLTIQRNFTEADPPHTEWVPTLLLDAARIRLRADVPVGAYFGIDSTVKSNFDNRLNTFSVQFSDKRLMKPPFSKLPYPPFKPTIVPSSAPMKISATSSLKLSIIPRCP
jgi:asparagine synthetase B (glutamine-hydrolysing)